MTEQPHEVLLRAADRLADGDDNRLVAQEVKPPLVAWLRATAKYAWVPKGLESNAVEDVVVEPALAFARMVLGEAT